MEFTNPTIDRLLLLSQQMKNDLDLKAPLYVRLPGAGAVDVRLDDIWADYINVKRFGAVGDGIKDDSQAFQDAFDEYPHIYIPPTSAAYKITRTIDLDTQNRFHIWGVGLNSRIDFNPTTNSDILFSASGNLDNCLFDNFYVNFANANSKSNAGAFNIDSTCNTIDFSRVTINGFNGFGIQHDEAQNDTFFKCRFINMDNSANNDHLAKAIYLTTYGNNITIDKCRFSSNDQAVRIINGNAVRIRDCSFEANGDSGNTFGGIMTVYVSDVNGFDFTGNYIEDNTTDTNYAVLRVDGGSGINISRNAFHGDYGGTTHSNYFIWFDDSCILPVVENNLFSEIIQGFIYSGGSKVITRANKYIDGSATLSTYNGIMALMGNPAYIELDIDYTFTWDPASLDYGLYLDSSNQTVTGVRAGDLVGVTAPYTLDGVQASAYYHADNTVQVHLYNSSGATKDFASGDWRLKVIKAK